MLSKCFGSWPVWSLCYSGFAPIVTCAKAGVGMSSAAYTHMSIRYVGMSGEPALILQRVIHTACAGPQQLMVMTELY